MLFPHSLVCNPVFGRGVSLRAKRRVYQAVVRPILLYGCETWPARVADERMLAVFDNDSTHRIVHVRRSNCVPTTELRCRLHLTSIPVQLI